MQKKLIEKGEVLEVIKNFFMQEHEMLKVHPVNEQNIIGNKLTVLEIELKKLIKGLTFRKISSKYRRVRKFNKRTNLKY